MEIRELFDKLDQDKNKYLTGDELIVLMKQTSGKSVTVD
jgi:Ca2+-binding EF-hand superfamily protein